MKNNRRVIIRLLIGSVFSLLAVSAYSQVASADALIMLKEGNSRFYTGEMLHQHQDSVRVNELRAGQHPFAVVVSCSDSRVTPDFIFDQGLGDLFAIRTAGNIMGDFEEGSIEYAVEHLSTKLVVVIGHTGCGAVKAFLDTEAEGGEHSKVKSHAESLGHIQAIVDKMKSEDEEKEVLKSDGDHYEKAVVANVKNGVKQLRTSDPILARMYEAGTINIVGAIYHIESGKVEFLEY